MARLKAWIKELPAKGQVSPVFPSQNLASPLWAENVLRNYVRPKLKPICIHINFAIVRRTTPLSTKDSNQTLRSLLTSKVTDWESTLNSTFKRARLNVAWKLISCTCCS